MSHVVLKFLFK